MHNDNESVSSAVEGSDGLKRKPVVESQRDVGSESEMRNIVTSS